MADYTDEAIPERDPAFTLSPTDNTLSDDTRPLVPPRVAWVRRAILLLLAALDARPLV